MLAELTAQIEQQRGPLPHNLDNIGNVLVGCAGLLDNIKIEWSAEGCWSEWDQSVRDGVTRQLQKLEQQREGQGEPVAWLHESDDETFLTAKLHAYWSKQNDGAGILKRYSRPLYTAPQNSVPAWAWRQAFDEWKFDMNIPIAKGADWIESRARALAATPSKSGNIEPV